jgi:hypothetical protein
MVALDTYRVPFQFESVPIRLGESIKDLLQDLVIVRIASVDRYEAEATVPLFIRACDLDDNLRGRVTAVGMNLPVQADNVGPLCRRSDLCLDALSLRRPDHRADQSKVQRCIDELFGVQRVSDKKHLLLHAVGGAGTPSSPRRTQAGTRGVSGRTRSPSLIVHDDHRMGELARCLEALVREIALDAHLLPRLSEPEASFGGDIRKVAPSPSCRGSRLSLSPTRASVCREMWRPIPRPPGFLEKFNAKMFSRSLVLTPGPLSRTKRSTPSLSNLISRSPRLRCSQ